MDEIYNNMALDDNVSSGNKEEIKFNLVIK